jgi:hypothetical protein
MKFIALEGLHMDMYNLFKFTSILNLIWDLNFFCTFTLLFTYFLYMYYVSIWFIILWKNVILFEIRAISTHSIFYC